MLEVNPLGPVQLKTAPEVVEDPLRLIVLGEQLNISSEPALTFGIGFITTVVDTELNGQLPAAGMVNVTV